MTHAAHIAFIEHELNDFHQSLLIYRQQMGAWYSRALDSVSDGLEGNLKTNNPTFTRRK